MRTGFSLRIEILREKAPKSPFPLFLSLPEVLLEATPVFPIFIFSTKTETNGRIFEKPINLEGVSL